MIREDLGKGLDLWGSQGYQIDSGWPKQKLHAPPTPTPWPALRLVDRFRGCHIRRVMAWGFQEQYRDLNIVECEWIQGQLKYIEREREMQHRCKIHMCVWEVNGNSMQSTNLEALNSSFSVTQWEDDRNWKAVAMIMLYAWNIIHVYMYIITFKTGLPY